MIKLKTLTVVCVLILIVAAIVLCGCSSPTTPGTNANHNFYLDYAKSAVEHIEHVDQSALSVSDVFDEKLGTEYAEISYVDNGTHHVVNVVVQGHNYYGANVGYDIEYYNNTIR